MSYSALAHMSRRRRVLVLALLSAGTVYALALPLIVPSDLSYLLASFIGFGALATLLDWRLEKNLADRPRMHVLLVDAMPAAGIFIALVLWGEALGWFSLVIAAFWMGMTILSARKKPYGHEVTP
jgi:hypothetical protein